MMAGKESIIRAIRGLGCRQICPDRSGDYTNKNDGKQPFPGRLRTSLEAELEARAGIEPACTDLQSAASPLRHRALQVGRRKCAALAAKSSRLRGASRKNLGRPRAKPLGAGRTLI